MPAWTTFGGIPASAISAPDVCRSEWTSKTRASLSALMLPTVFQAANLTYAERSGHMAIATAGRPHLRLEHAVSVLEVTPAGRAARILQHGGSSRGGDKVIRTELETEVLALPEEDRVRLVELLWESLTPRDVQARAEKWSAESERRLDAVQAGRLPSIDAAKVF